MATASKGRKRKPLSVRQVALKHGFRSGLEDTIAAKLKADGVPYKYEELVINYIKPARKAKYTPDFVLDNGIIIESKGRFLVADRQKHLFVKEQHPELDIRFVFSNSKQRISKASTTTYADWCIRYNFKYADKAIPKEWIDESGKSKG